MKKPEITTPQTITVAGHIIKVKIVKNLRDEGISCYGLFSYGEGDLTISLAEGLSPSTHRSTLAHELLHAALHLSGQSELLNETQEEALVTALEYQYYPMLKRLIKAGHL